MTAVAIVGGGPAGMALALALHYHGVSAEVLEARERQAVRQDGRVLALSHGARQILTVLGAWPPAQMTPIASVHVSHRGGFGRVRIEARELDVPALGYVVPAAALIDLLDAAVTRAGIPYHDQHKVGPSPGFGQAVGDTALPGYELTARAEGAVDATQSRQRDYGQHAVLCSVGSVAPHRQVAWERFTGDGPVALLPLGTRYSVVLTVESVVAQEVLALDDKAFLGLLQQRFGERHRFLEPSPRVAYPLGLRWREKPIGERQVWIGNAAQTLPPVAGQGFNLALRDIWELARHLGRAADCGDPEILAAYARSRVLDRDAAIGFTNLLIDGFGTDAAPLRQLRGAGLLALDLAAPLRNILGRRMMYGTRAWP